MKKDCRMSHPVWKWIFGIFFFLIALYVVFAISSMIVFKFQHMAGWYGGDKFTSYQKKSDCNFGGTMMKRWGKEDRLGTVRVFGTITKIEGNLITILNNGAQEQAVISAADTVIMSYSAEVGLAALKVDAGAVFMGRMNVEKQLEAKLIQLQ